MRRSLLATAALLAIACGGLLYNQGNGFPCDFSAPEEERDKACAPTEVCSVLNRCERFVYEGPQFEGPPQLPQFDGGKIHPLVLDHPVTLVTAAARERDELLVVTALDDGGLRSVTAKLGTVTTVRDSTFSAVGIRQVALVSSTFGGQLLVSGQTRLLDGGIVLPGSPGIALRAGLGGLGLLREKNSKGTALSLDVQGNVAIYAPALDGGIGKVLDLRSVPLSRKIGMPEPRPLALTAEGFFIVEMDGGFLKLTPGEDAASLSIPIGEPDPKQVSLRHDFTGSLWAFSRPKAIGPLVQPVPTVLSTWFLKRNGETPVSMERAWNDCSPCGTGRIFALAPNLDGLANVEVLCGGAVSSATMSLVRVIGALSADPDDPCVTQPVTPGFDLARRTVGGNLPVVLDESNGGGVLVGGQHGEVWSGPSFSLALPLFLERVPLAIGTLSPGSGDPIALVVTDRYLAVQLPSPGLVNGFKAVDFRKASDFVLDSDTGVRALVGGIGGWGVLSTGDLTRVSVRSQSPDAGPGSYFALTYGPRLVTARGEASREPFFGEAVTMPDGGVVSLVLTADDSVYLAPAPGESSAPNALQPLFPQLTPEPGSPIRSFALERTRLGTNGIDRVRGYAVTSRSLFTVSLSGEPARWSATPLLLGGGEPLEVWMDNPRGGLARVGYRDGTVFTLPGGFQLVRPTAGEEPRQVMDYENLGGWPIAYATSGLYVGRWDQDPETKKLDNKLADGRPGKPMTWRKVTMGDGSTPWMNGATARPGRLHVLAGPPPRTQPYEQKFRLFLYLDDAVYEVGSMLRTNGSAAP